MKVKNILNNKHLNRNEFPEGKNNYTLFNREYYWSPGFKNIFADEWVEIDKDFQQTNDSYNDNPTVDKVLPAYIDFFVGRTI